MRKKNEFLVYTCMWALAVVALLALLMQNVGDARVVNYSGIVRGATQKLVKEELAGQPDDGLILYLDGIIQNLRTGRGEFDLQRNRDQAYQNQLARLDETWERLKEEIGRLREGEDVSSALYELSQEHYSAADQMVLLAVAGSERKLQGFIALYAVVLVISVCVFTMLNSRNRKALETSIYTDNLTGILNRVGFESGAATLLRQRTGAYCLIEFDVDDFKFLNSSYGYEVGDSLLRALARGLRQAYHGEQLCARIDADDFVILAKQTPGAVEGLRDLLGGILQSEELSSLAGFLTFTVGGYEIADNSEVIQSVMDKANMAHKHAKTLGKGTTAWYDAKLLVRLNQENKLKNRLGPALSAGEFKMYLQPKYRLSDLSIQGAEALVRWDFPGYGIVPPDEFIPLFERNGSISDIDFCMLRQACDFLRGHRLECGEDFSIAVNFSRVTIYQQRFLSTMLGIVDEYGIPHHCIEVEVTESAFNEVGAAMVGKLRALQAKGFIIAMDDFGSGYSSLNLLDKLPIQVLKLDREFLREFERAARVKDVIICVTELAHRLNISVVCEGIEEGAHVAFLKEIGCEYGQGFYFARPMPLEAFRLQAGSVK